MAHKHSYQRAAGGNSNSLATHIAAPHLEDLAHNQADWHQGPLEASQDGLGQIVRRRAGPVLCLRWPLVTETRMFFFLRPVVSCTTTNEPDGHRW
jgi:hypothetical protein